MANDEGFTKDSLKTLKVIGVMRNNWRQRMVTICQHPTRQDDVVTFGTPFDEGETIVCVEPKIHFENCIQIFPKTHIYN
jgi:hypothetical protein